jgi:hypothetical protein
MTSPARKPVAPPEATQELQALDVVEIVQTPMAPSVRAPVSSNSSIAPVGLEIRPHKAAAADEEVNPTMEIHLPVRRRRLGVVVGAALSACALILVAAGVARVVHASSGPEGAAGDLRTNAAVTAATAPASLAPASTATSQATAASASVPAATTSTVASSSGVSTGTVRLDRPAYPGHVWLDGKKLASSSAMVSCGTHQIKVGFRRAHSIDVPCGGELGVSR